MAVLPQTSSDASILAQPDWGARPARVSVLPVRVVQPVEIGRDRGHKRSGNSADHENDSGCANTQKRVGEKTEQTRGDKRPSTDATALLPLRLATRERKNWRGCTNSFLPHCEAMEGELVVGLVPTMAARALRALTEG